MNKKCHLIVRTCTWSWWHTPLITARERLRQEGSRVIGQPALKTCLKKKLFGSVCDLWEMSADLNLENPEIRDTGVRKQVPSPYPSRKWEGKKSGGVSGRSLLFPGEGLVVQRVEALHLGASGGFPDWPPRLIQHLWAAPSCQGRQQQVWAWLSYLKEWCSYSDWPACSLCHFCSVTLGR